MLRKICDRGVCLPARQGFAFGEKNWFSVVVLAGIITMIISFSVVVAHEKDEESLSIPEKEDLKDIISGKGTIKYIDLEGGFYGIVGDNGERYEVHNLSKEFQIDGLRVYFEAKIQTDVMCIHMWGTLIELSKIERL